MSCGASELESLESEESVAAPGPLPAPRSPEPRVPVPEPGLDLSLSPPPASPERRKGRAERRGPAGRQVRFRLEPSELEAPSVHSSLGLGLELRAARVAAGGRFDAARAVEEQLRTSFQARCALEESVAEGLNVPRSKRLFRDLVSLRVPEEQVLDAALRDKLSLLPPPHARAPPPKEPPAPGPDMTVLCDPRTLCYEPPHLAVDGLPPLRLQARARPSEDTFLMHRTLRRWEA